MLRTPFIETLSDLFIRSSQWRGREELFVDEQDRITGSSAFDQSLAWRKVLPISAPRQAR